MTVKSGGQPESIHDLKRGMALSGVVKRLELFGAFVDVGLDVEGVLHISQLDSDGHVRNVSDVLHEGDRVEVWVHHVDREKNRFFLTMVRPAAVTWDDLKANAVFSGTVTRLDRFAAYVDFGAEREGRVHVSELAEGYVKAPEDVVKVGDQVEVRVIKINRRKGQIDLSMKVAHSAVIEAGKVAQEEDEPVLTAMEAAFRRAMEGTDLEEELAQARRRSRKKKRRRGDRRYQEQASLLARTLEQRKE